MPEEGQHLARLAKGVPPERAIVEIGSHTGLSTLWMAGSARAHITAVDPWPEPRPDPGEGCDDDPFRLGSGDAVFARFCANVAAEGMWGRITPLRTTSAVAAQVWCQPIGLLFVDAVHEYEHVRSDYLHWQAHIPVGGWLAFHDYTEDPTHPYHGVARAIRDVIPADQWSAPTIVRNTWSARRILTP